MTEPTTPPTVSPNFAAFNGTRVLIPRPAEQVWAMLFERDRWMPAFVRREHVDGPTGEVGERYRVHSRQADSSSVRMEETLALEAARRLVIRMALPDDSATMSFAEWRLEPGPEGTTLEFNVYWLDVPKPGADWPATRAQRADYMAHTQASIEATVARFRDAVVDAS